MKKLIFLLVCILVLNVSAVFAVASLADGDQIDIKIKIDKVEEYVTCVRDAIKTEQWYYAPNKLRLAEIKDQKTKKNEADFFLMTYQTRDPGNPSFVVTAGLMQVSMNLSLPDDGLNQLKEALAKHTSLDKSKILIAPLALRNARISVYTPGGVKVGDATITPFIGPSFNNRSISLQANLIKIDADFHEALLKTGGGVLVTGIFDFNGLTPSCSFKVIVDWEKTIKHFSNNKALAEYNKFFVSERTKADIQTIRKSLVNSNCIKVESISGATFKPEEIDTYLLPILENINKKIFNIVTPEKVILASAAKPSLPSREWDFSAGVNFILADSKKAMKGQTTYAMDRQFIVPRQIIAGGMIGIGNYSKEIQDKFFAVLPLGSWHNSFYFLPDLASAGDIGVISLSLVVTVLDDRGKMIAPKQAAFWKSSTGTWLDAKGNQCKSLLFPLAGILQTFKGDEAKLLYQQDFEMIQQTGTKSIAFTRKSPVINGEVAVGTAMSGLECISVNGDLLTWSGNDSDLIAVSVVLKNAKTKNTILGTLKHDLTQLHLLIDKDKDDELQVITGDFKFNSKQNRKTVSYKNLLEEMGEDIYLTDFDYLSEK